MSSPLPNITGGPAASTSGAARGSQSGTAFSQPVVIGGFKTDGTASAALPSGLLWIAGGIAVAIGLFWFFSRRT